MTSPLQGEDHQFESGWAHMNPFFPSGMLTAVSLSFSKEKVNKSVHGKERKRNSR
jgi:hypothetical protein